MGENDICELGCNDRYFSSDGVEMCGVDSGLSSENSNTMDQVRSPPLHLFNCLRGILLIITSDEDIAEFV